MRKLFIGCILALFTFTVNAAEPLRWVGVPVFYSKFMPKLAPCIYAPESSYGFCGWKQYPEEGKVGVVSQEDQPLKESFTVLLYDEVVCVKGECSTNYGEPRGRLDTQETAYWYIPKGYYLTPLNGLTTAVKYGNGPLTHKYPIRAVKLLPEYNELPDGEYIPEEKERDVYDVWCNAAAECSYMGRVMRYDELSRIIPKRLTMQCDERFCYNTAARVIGLNPKFN